MVCTADIDAGELGSTLTERVFVTFSAGRSTRVVTEEVGLLCSCWGLRRSTSEFMMATKASSIIQAKLLSFTERLSSFKFSLFFELRGKSIHPHLKTDNFLTRGCCLKKSWSCEECYYSPYLTSSDCFSWQKTGCIIPLALYPAFLFCQTCEKYIGTEHILV